MEFQILFSKVNYNTSLINIFFRNNNNNQYFTYIIVSSNVPISGGGSIAIPDSVQQGKF